jgi:hypothetical protein
LLAQQTPTGNQVAFTLRGGFSGARWVYRPVEVRPPVRISALRMPMASQGASLSADQALCAASGGPKSGPRSFAGKKARRKIPGRCPPVTRDAGGHHCVPSVLRTGLGASELGPGAICGEPGTKVPTGR